LCLLKIALSKRSITANAQGFILSERAAGSIITKNHHLLEFFDDHTVASQDNEDGIFSQLSTDVALFKIFLTTGETVVNVCCSQDKPAHVSVLHITFSSSELATIASFA
jgi:hypothetical protein